MFKFLKKNGLVILSILLLLSPMVTIPVICATAPIGVVEKILVSIGVFMASGVFAGSAYGVQYLIDSKSEDLDKLISSPLTNDDIEQLEALKEYQTQKSKNLSAKKQPKKSNVIVEEESSHDLGL